MNIAVFSEKQGEAVVYPPTDKERAGGTSPDPG